jgi:hypothetical protein
MSVRQKASLDPHAQKESSKNERDLHPFTTAAAQGVIMLMRRTVLLTPKWMRSVLYQPSPVRQYLPTNQNMSSHSHTFHYHVNYS